ncbi:MAG: lysophospholipase [Candidatus Kapabacteria bacterium]|jgi:pimeloyl-ACP methyl ester carboxylesterase|nr:lysophospholipase [Candidatus Kapabacteria bacterium]
MHYTSYSIPVTTYTGAQIALQCFRAANDGAQPLILYAGFYQNAFFWDLSEQGGSLAAYLCEQGYDVWAVHQRGTGGSGGKKLPNSLDDLAAFDTPAIISFVRGATGKKPIFIGHSQGGITTLLSLMGAVKNASGTVSLDPNVAQERHDSLQSIVTIGSFPNMTYPTTTPLQNFVKNGIQVTLFGKTMTLISSLSILNIVKHFNYIPVPISVSLREAILDKWYIRLLLFPLAFVLDAIAVSGMVGFLYNKANVSREARIRLFYRTFEGSFSGIINQYYWTVLEGQMYSNDKTVNYSAHYHLVKLPVCCVAMQDDQVENPITMKEQMFDSLGSSNKHYILWENQGHEDFVMNPAFFPLLSEAIKKVAY